MFSQGHITGSKAFQWIWVSRLWEELWVLATLLGYRTRERRISELTTVLPNPAPWRHLWVSVNTFMTIDWFELLNLLPIKINSIKTQINSHPPPERKHDQYSQFVKEILSHITLHIPRSRTGSVVSPQITFLGNSLDKNSYWALNYGYNNPQIYSWGNL